VHAALLGYQVHELGAVEALLLRDLLEIRMDLDKFHVVHDVPYIGDGEDRLDALEQFAIMRASLSARSS